jgi:hypothetical protein
MPCKLVKSSSGVYRNLTLCPQFQRPSAPKTKDRHYLSILRPFFSSLLSSCVQSTLPTLPLVLSVAIAAAEGTLFNPSSRQLAAPSPCYTTTTSQISISTYCGETHTTIYIHIHQPCPLLTTMSFLFSGLQASMLQISEVTVCLPDMPDIIAPA